MRTLPRVIFGIVCLAIAGLVFPGLMALTWGVAEWAIPALRVTGEDDEIPRSAVPALLALSFPIALLGTALWLKFYQRLDRRFFPRDARPPVLPPG